METKNIGLIKLVGLGVEATGYEWFNFIEHVTMWFLEFKVCNTDLNLIKQVEKAINIDRELITHEDKDGRWCLLVDDCIVDVDERSHTYKVTGKVTRRPCR